MPGLKTRIEEQSAENPRLAQQAATEVALIDKAIETELVDEGETVTPAVIAARKSLVKKQLDEDASTCHVCSKSYGVFRRKCECANCDRACCSLCSHEFKVCACVCVSVCECVTQCTHLMAAAADAIVGVDGAAAHLRPVPAAHCRAIGSRHDTGLATAKRSQQRSSHSESPLAAHQPARRGVVPQCNVATVAAQHDVG